MSRPRSVWRVLAFAIVVTLFIGLGFSAWSINRWINPSAHTFAIDPQATLTEEAAIDYTRRALTAESKDRPNMRPLPYWPEDQFEDPNADRLFARNRINPNNGYVIWSVGYVVRIEQAGGEVACRVYASK